jgi:hypothetical protein
MEAAGAELLVVGTLMIEGLQAFRAYGNQPGYDVVAINPSSQKSKTIQVKSRVAVDSGQFKIGNENFDFIIFVRLNRGTKAERKNQIKLSGSVTPPKFYVVPLLDLTRMAEDDDYSGVRRVSGSLVVARREFDADGWCERNYRDKWELIYEALR